jgi:hypothetical protein
MKRKIGLLLAAVATVAASMFAATGMAHAQTSSWMGPFQTFGACNQSVPWVTVNGVSGWDLNRDGRPDASWVGSCAHYSDGYWYPYTAL